MQFLCVFFLSLTSTDGERFFHREIKNFPHTGNPPPAYQHMSLNSIREKSLGRAEVICVLYIPPKKQILGFL
jgi:hypothetical protein